VDPDDGLEADEPLFPWLPPDDRLWRHPSELAAGHPISGSSSGSASGSSPGAGSVSSAGSVAGSPTGRRGGVRTAISTIPGLSPRDIDRRLWTVALFAGVVGALLASGAGVVAGQYHRSTTVIRPIEQMVDPANPYVTVATSPQPEDVVGGIADHLKPSIVELLVNGNPATGSGSGVIFRSDGYILTNQHVVDGAQSLVAVTFDGRRIKCRLVGTDRATDIAVVQLQDNKSRPVATLGTSTQLRVGQLAIAIGSPVSLSGGHSVTTGIISAVDLHVSSTNGLPLLDMIKTDATIEAGSSGGALVDASGMVVGITTAVALSDQTTTLALATPIEVAEDVANQLLTTGRVTHTWLGVQGTDLDAGTGGALGIQHGAMVQVVDSHSPAARAGLSTGDVITMFAGQSIDSEGTLETVVRQHRPGDEVGFTFIHDREPRAAVVVLLERPVPDYP
jgi:S1-C subfamily serine protease